MVSKSQPLAGPQPPPLSGLLVEKAPGTSPSSHSTFSSSRPGSRALAHPVSGVRHLEKPQSDLEGPRLRGLVLLSRAPQPLCTQLCPTLEPGRLRPHQMGLSGLGQTRAGHVAEAPGTGRPPDRGVLRQVWKALRVPAPVAEHRHDRHHAADAEAVHRGPRGQRAQRQTPHLCRWVTSNVGQSH